MSFSTKKQHKKTHESISDDVEEYLKNADIQYIASCVSGINEDQVDAFKWPDFESKEAGKNRIPTAREQENLS
ncbi:MAG: hypothetical protein HRU20_28965 [Pseudomonadales bacterium]|nr:hypothetical protein [Pseudomonadales bacterium]